MNWTEFFAMGGHAVYIWPVYGIAAVILAFNVIQPVTRRRTVFKRLRQYYRIKSKAR